MMQIKNLKKAAQRILKAVKNKENIILYGDADLDGTASVIILKEAIANLGGQVTIVYFPDREKEGYGLNFFALNFLEKFSPALLIALDCGITNFEEAKEAKKQGFELIIIDHHVPLDKLPKASVIVDPKQKGDKAFKEYSAAGLTYKLSQVLLGKKLSDSMKRNFLELAALSTIADMMPEREENKEIVDEGLFALQGTFRPGLRVFLEMNEIKNLEDIRQKAQEIISFLNTVEPTKEGLNNAYLLLSAASIEEAQVLAEGFLKKREEKRAQIKEITAQVEEKILQKPDEKIVFEGSASWPVALLGAAASRICSRYQKPTFIFSQVAETLSLLPRKRSAACEMTEGQRAPRSASQSSAKEKESRGAVRMPSGFDGVAMMQKCSKYLLSFGGHPLAAGFLIKNENLEEFKQCLINQL